MLDPQDLATQFVRPTDSASRNSSLNNSLSERSWGKAGSQNGGKGEIGINGDFFERGIEMESIRGQLKSAQIEVNYWKNMYDTEVGSLRERNMHYERLVKEKNRALKDVMRNFRQLQSTIEQLVKEKQALQARCNSL